MLRTLIEKAKVFDSWRNAFGAQAAFYFGVHRAKIALGFPEPAEFKMRPRHSQHPVSARLRGSSDMSVLFQIFFFDEYGCLRNLKAPRLIFDLGANVGYSSAYFLSAFPTASIVAVEPDPENFAACQRNVAAFGGRARLVRGAVWSERCQLALTPGSSGDGREWAREVRLVKEKEEATVEAWDIPSLLRLTDNAEIDLLKVDIEGSETSLFGPNSAAWLPKVKNICIELHGPACEEVFFAALTNYDYDLGHSGELTICTNLRQTAMPT